MSMALYVFFYQSFDRVDSVLADLLIGIDGLQSTLWPAR